MQKPSDWFLLIRGRAVGRVRPYPLIGCLEGQF